MRRVQRQRGLAIRRGPTVARDAPYGLAGLVRRRAGAAPDAVAVVDAGGTLSYDDLEVASDDVAARLRDAGATAGDVVAVCLDRGRAMSVALLGAVKAGTPYLPLAVDDPPARRAGLAADAGAVVVLTDGACAPLVTGLGLPVVVVEPDAVAGADWEPLPHREPGHPVYVLYTSGSTGAPKGVVLPTSALVNRLQWMVDQFSLTPSDRTLQKTPYTFDVSGWELWCPLLSGGCVVHLPPEAHKDPAEIVAWVEKHEITLCHFVPSMLEEFLRWPGAETCRSLRAVFSSGEALSPGQAERFAALLEADLHNLYGPTEAAIEVSWWTCPRPFPARGAVLIGEPISNCTLLAIDESGALVRGEEPGQLAIGGTPLATGYLGRPDLTATAFVDAPAGSAVERVYLTGDLVRFRPEGIEYLGRRDDQVKVRGVRIELGEVEDALRRSDRVADVVVVPDDGPDGTRLCAFVEPAPGIDRADVEGLRDGLLDELRATLPEAYVPSELVTVEAIPYTGSGKRDRSALRDLVPQTEDTAPTDAGDPLATLWRLAVGSDAQAGIGFVSAGGHSLAAVRVAGALLRRWGVRVPLATFLRDDVTLEGLRALLPDRPGAGPDQAPDPPARRSDPTRAPLAPEQRRLWLHQSLHPDSPAYNVVGVLRCSVAPDPEALRRAGSRLAARHETLRTRVVEEGTDLVQVVEPAVDTPLTTGSGTLAGLVDELAGAVFRPDRLPRLRLGLHRDDGTAHVVLVVDHLVSDQRSLDVLLHDLASCYALESGAPAASLDLGRLRQDPVQYGDLLAEATPDPDRERADLAFWRQHLADAPDGVTLPFQMPRPTTAGLTGHHVDADLDPEVSGRLEAHLRGLGHTVATAALAALTRVVADWSGQDDLVIGVPVSGRESPHSWDTVGFFMRTLPLRLTAPSGQAAEELLDSTRSAVLTAVEHASVPFDEIVAAVGHARDASRNPLFQVWFNDLTHADPPRSFAGGPATVVEPDPRWALFDLGLYAGRRPDGGLRLRLVHAADLWDVPVATAFVDQCRDRLLAMLGPVGGPEPAPEPVRWAGSGSTTGDLVDRVLAHAARHPERTAVAAVAGPVTWRELAARVHGFRETLIDLEPGAPVVLLARRDPGLAAAVLGCWRAGCPPLLLDAAAPASWRASAAGAVGATRVLDTAAPPVAGIVRPPSGTPAGHALATSGTTGSPVVVRLPSDALPDAFAWYASALGLGPDDIFCFTAPPAHDPMFRDVLLPLWLGATLHVPDGAALTDPRRLAAALADCGATVWHVTPSWARLVTALDGVRLPALRHVVFHGEAAHDADAAAVARLAPAAEVHDLYGSTETPQAAGLRTWQDGTRRPVPLPHRAVTVTDATGDPAPVGVLGEVVVTGAGLATGYAGVTSRRPPTPLPGHGEDDVRRFATGDLGRHSPDGGVELAGRSDRQASVGGYRIEPAGIERVLVEAPGVRACAVRADEALTAWFVGDGSASEPEIRGHLRERLPGWAVPTRLVRVTALPTTRHGKVDLAALPTLEGTATMNEPTPGDRTPDATSARISALATAIVREQQPGAAPVGEDARFFEAGMTSMDLVRLHRALSDDEGHPLALLDVFTHPTPRQLAAHLHADESVSGRPARPRRRRPSRRGGTGAR